MESPLGDKVALLVRCWTSNPASVYSMLPQSTHNGYLALIRHCLELVRFMLPAALEYPSGDWNGLCVYRPAMEGRSCEHFGGYMTINRMPLPLPCLSGPWSLFLTQCLGVETLMVKTQCVMVGHQHMLDSQSDYFIATRLILYWRRANCTWILQYAFTFSPDYLYSENPFVTRYLTY